MAIDDIGLQTPNWDQVRYTERAGRPYPVNVHFEAPEQRRRLWAIPLFGYVAKLVILIPHVVCLAILAWLVGVSLPGPLALFGARLVNTFAVGNFFSPDIAGFALEQAIATLIGITVLGGGVQLVLWMWVLFGGRYPTWGVALVGGTLRWSARVTAFTLGLTDRYPPFSLKGQPEGRAVDTFVSYEVPPRSVRWWAVPFLGLWSKGLALIPHFVVLAVLGTVAAFVGQLVVPLFVLFSGRYPRWALPLVGGTLRWWTRVLAFVLGLTDRYPPFSLR